MVGADVVDELGRGLALTDDLEPEPLEQARQPFAEQNVDGSLRVSAVASSAASMIAEAWAAGSVSPFPWLTASVLAFGRTAIQTGIPMRSRPVT